MLHVVTETELRVATIKDVPVLARRWYAEKPKTCFAKVHVEWTEEGCAAFLTEIIDNPNHLLACNDTLTAAIGATLYHELLPPHPLVAYEWMWWGDQKRAVVELLHMAMSWAKFHKAVGFRYILNVPSKSATKFTETNRWEVL